MKRTLTEELCKNCPFFTYWSGPYGGAEYPACSHRESGPRSVNLLDDMDECPKE